MYQMNQNSIQKESELCIERISIMYRKNQMYAPNGSELCTE